MAMTGRGESGVWFDTTGFMRGMRLASPVLQQLALVDIRQHAENIAARAKALAPVGTPEEGDPHPGAMRDDIGIKGEGIDNKGAFVDVGTHQPYGLYQEFGTVHNPAHPFMRPAIAAELGSGALPTRINIAANLSLPFRRVRRARRSR